jgi:signal transduction histidine kinase
VPLRLRAFVGAFAADVARQLADMAAGRDVAIHVAPDLPQLVLDPARLELVFLNLISNAIKYSDPAKPARLVEVIAAEGPADRCVLVVRDNGIGIPPADCPAIFDRFVRAHAHLDAELGVTGAGLGLAIVVDCVEALGGSIRCESEVGQGTAFFVTLPARTDD